MLVVIVLALVYIKYIFGWLELRKNNYTPKEYKSIVHVSKERYSRDSLNLIFVIRNKIMNHQDPYANFVRVNEKIEYINDNLTNVYIDTIFYSQDLKRVTFLVIVENENKKLYKGMTRTEAEGWAKDGNLPYDGTFFDGNCFIAKRKNDTFESYYYGYSVSNSRNYVENSTSLRNACLNHREDSNNKRLTYNIDDVRFWSIDDWNFVK